MPSRPPPTRRNREYAGEGRWPTTDHVFNPSLHRAAPGLEADWKCDAPHCVPENSHDQEGHISCLQGCGAAHIPQAPSRRSRRFAGGCFFSSAACDVRARSHQFAVFRSALLYWLLYFSPAPVRVAGSEPSSHGRLGMRPLGHATSPSPVPIGGARQTAGPPSGGSRRDVKRPSGDRGSRQADRGGNRIAAIANAPTCAPRTLFCSQS